MKKDMMQLNYFSHDEVGPPSPLKLSSKAYSITELLFNAYYFRFAVRKI